MSFWREFMREWRPLEIAEGARARGLTVREWLRRQLPPDVDDGAVDVLVSLVQDAEKKAQRWLVDELAAWLHGLTDQLREVQQVPGAAPGTWIVVDCEGRAYSVRVEPLRSVEQAMACLDEDGRGA